MMRRWGGWTAVDPEGQFFDLYAYSGNDYNPINAHDDDGNYLFLAAAAPAVVTGLTALALNYPRIAPVAMRAANVITPIAVQVEMLAVKVNQAIVPAIVKASEFLESKPIAPFAAGAVGGALDRAQTASKTMDYVGETGLPGVTPLTVGYSVGNEAAGMAIDAFTPPSETMKIQNTGSKTAPTNHTVVKK